MSDKRWADIESRIAHQELAISELNAIVYRQRRELDQLEAAYKHLLARVREISAASDGGPSEELPPPHY